MVYGTSQWWFSWDQNEHGESDYVEPPRPARRRQGAALADPPASCPGGIDPKPDERLGSTLGVRQSRRIRGIGPAWLRGSDVFREGVRRRSDSRLGRMPGPLSAASSLADCGSEKARRGSRDKRPVPHMADQLIYPTTQLTNRSALS